MFTCIKMYLALNNLQWLICHKTKQNQTNQEPTVNFEPNPFFDPSGLIFLILSTECNSLNTISYKNYQT